MKTNKEKLLLGGSLLAMTSLLIKFISLSFNVYLTNRLGSAGIGLITLVNSVYSFAVTLATSGIRLASTKLCAVSLGRGSQAEIRAVMKKCLAYSLTFGCLSMLLLLSLARPIGERLLDDRRTVRCLMLLSPALPFISCASALSGYFNAMRRVYKNAVTTVLEQGIKISLTVFLLTLLMPKGLEYCCIAVICSTAVSEGASFVFSYVMYRLDLRRHIGREGSISASLKKDLFSISLPIALTQYARSGLLTLEHMLIPKGLKKYGRSQTAALAEYGVLQAMALPVVLFPLAVLSSFTSLMVPDISEAKARDDGKYINRAVSRVLELTLVFSFLTEGAMFAFSERLGISIYNSTEAGQFIRLFALLIPVMYFDSAVDALLQGIGEQVYSMKVNIIDAGLSVLLVYLVLPRCGIYGYVGIIFFCEILNASLSFIHLIKKTEPSLSFLYSVFIPSLGCVGSLLLTLLLRNLGAFSFSGDIFPLCLEIFSYVLFFCIIISLLTNNRYKTILMSRKTKNVCNTPQNHSRLFFSYGDNPTDGKTADRSDAAL